MFMQLMAVTGRRRDFIASSRRRGSGSWREPPLDRCRGQTGGGSPGRSSAVAVLADILARPVHESRHLRLAGTYVSCPIYPKGCILTDVGDGSRAQLFDLYTRLKSDLLESFDLDLIPLYGTMLGAVRENDFIDADHDFDVGYISNHAEPGAVRDEFKRLCGHLISSGYNLAVDPAHTEITLNGSGQLLDLHFGWFNSDGYLDVSYGYHGSPVKRSAEFTAFRAEKLGDFSIPMPLNAEAILEQLYGSTWNSPDPNFTHDAATRKLDRRYQLTPTEVAELHWNQFYRDHKPDAASPFARFVRERMAQPATVVEFGCGNGRDGLFFAHQGWPTLCCDRSPEAIDRANEMLEASGGLPLSFDVVDVGSTEEIKRFIDFNAGQLDDSSNLMIYMRFFLHSIDETTQTTLLDTLTSTIRRPFRLCAEFRTLEDRNETKVYGEHYRRYIDHLKLADELTERWGFDVEHIEAGRGMSPYGDEDPYLARILARRGG